LLSIQRLVQISSAGCETWADQRVLELLDTPYRRPAWFATVFADQEETLLNLEQRGFASQADVGQDSWSKAMLRRSVDLAKPEGSLPSNFSIRPLAGASEVEAYVELHRAVFESRNMTVEWRNRTLRQTEHIPDLDLVAVALDGRLAAFYVGWLWRDNSGETSGQIEPMGVHGDYRNWGLGRAMLSINLRGMQLHGAMQVFVETDNYRSPALALYEMVGFQVFREILDYQKDYPVG
jgi:ribosomal protein S18 acetylase RimI-like enzyme